MGLHIIVIFLTVFGSSPVWATSEVALAMACLRPADCSDQVQKLQTQLQWNCELEIKSQNCAKLAEEHPDWAPLMRKCDLPSQCQQQKEYAQQKALACLRGYKNAMVDLGVSLKDMTVSLAGLVEDSWESIKKNNRERAAFLKQCNTSLSCKKDLVKDDHRYNKLSDEEINKLPATFLYVQAQDMKAYMSSLERVMSLIGFFPFLEKTKPVLLVR